MWLKDGDCDPPRSWICIGSQTLEGPVPFTGRGLEARPDTSSSLPGHSIHPCKKERKKERGVLSERRK